MKNIKFAFHEKSKPFKLLRESREFRRWDKGVLYMAYMQWLAEQFVFVFDKEPNTIYIGGRGFFMGFKPSFSLIISAISHETLHGVLIKMGEMEACKALDRFVNDQNVTRTGLKKF